MNLALKMHDNESCKNQGHHFTPIKAIIRDLVLFYKCIGINNIKKDLF